MGICDSNRTQQEILCLTYEGFFYFYFFLLLFIKKIQLMLEAQAFFCRALKARLKNFFRFELGSGSAWPKSELGSGSAQNEN